MSLTAFTDASLIPARGVRRTPPSSIRHFRNGQHVRAGTGLEMRHVGGWTTVRYDGDLGHLSGLAGRVYDLQISREPYYPPEGTHFFGPRLD